MQRLPSGVVLALTLSLTAPALAAGETLYRFVDERGVVHFSNQPSDARFVAVRSLTTRPKGLALSDKPPPQPRRRRSFKPPQVSAFDTLIQASANQHGLAPALIKAVIAAESNFDPKARSHKGAMGLMQLMPGTADELGVAKPYASAQNVEGGTRYLRSMVDRFSSLPKALAAYNAGPGAVDRFGGIPPYRETREYVQRVLAYYRAYHGDFAR